MENHEPASRPEEQSLDTNAGPVEEPGAASEGAEGANARPHEADARPAAAEGVAASHGSDARAAAAADAADTPASDDAEAAAASKTVDATVAEATAAPSSESDDAEALAAPTGEPGVSTEVAVPASGKSEPQAADDADALPGAGQPDEAEQQTEAGQLRKRVKLLSDTEAAAMKSAAAQPHDPSDGRSEPAGPPAPVRTGGYYGVPYLYRLGGERRRQSDCTVIFYQSAYQQIVEHLTADSTREHGGLLLGYESTTSGPGDVVVYVSQALPAQYTVGTPSRLTFTEDTWAEFADQTEGLVGTNLRRVGWYHSHPNFGIFLSPYDLDVCSNFQRQTQVALVYDPIRHEGGFFVRGEEDYDPQRPQGFWEYCDLTPDSIVDWKNVELVLNGGRHPAAGEDFSAALTEAGDSYNDGGTMANHNMVGARGGPSAPRVRVEMSSGHDRRGEAYGNGQERRTRRSRLKAFIQGILLGGVLTLLALAILLNAGVGRGYFGASDVNGALAELRENDKRQAEVLDQIRKLVAGNSRPASGPAGTVVLAGDADREGGGENTRAEERSGGETQSRQSAAASSGAAGNNAGRGRGGRGRQRRQTERRETLIPPRPQPGTPGRTQPGPATTPPPAGRTRPLRAPAATPTSTRPPSEIPPES